jgi:hypothetical protein
MRQAVRPTDPALGSEAETEYPGESQGGANYRLGQSADCRLRLARRQTMSDAEIKPAGKTEIKPVAKVENKSAATAENKQAAGAETKPAGKTENRQAGKGSKRRPFNAKQFAVNYGSIRWSKGQSQRPKH